MKKYLEIGKIVGTHAIKGEVRVEPWADSPAFLLPFKKLYFNDNGSEQADIISSRVHKNIVVMKLSGVDNVSDADKLRGRVLYCNRESAKLPAGRYFITDLIGLKIIDSETEHEYGVLKDISQLPANDVYHIEDESGKEHLFPAVSQFIGETSIEGGYIKIKPIKGMFED